MARISSAVLALFLCLVQTPFNQASNPLKLIDGSGSLTRASVPQSSLGNGIVAVLSSPGTKSFFPESDDGVSLSTSDGVSILSSPGATLSGTTSLTKGNGAAAAAAVSGSVIITGITESDLEYGLDDTRHGHTLTGIFRAKILSSSKSKTNLILAVPLEVDKETIIKDVKIIFKTANAEVGGDASFEELYDVAVELVSSTSDAERVSIFIFILWKQLKPDCFHFFSESNDNFFFAAGYEHGFAVGCSGTIGGKYSGHYR